MNLCIDIGNTKAKLGLFDGWELKANWSVPRSEIMAVLKRATNHSVENVILSTVAQDVGTDIAAMLDAGIIFIELDQHTPLPIKNEYRSPATLGKDRLAAVVGASMVQGESHKLVIDAGTCITYDLLADNQVFLGGNIVPGVQMRLQAMHTFTKRLPALERKRTESAIGYDTESAMLNGAQWGTIWELEGAIDYFAAEFEPLTVILTGGDANFLAKKAKRKIFVHQHLVLVGLNKILNYNVE